MTHVCIELTHHDENISLLEGHTYMLDGTWASIIEIDRLIGSHRLDHNTIAIHAPRHHTRLASPNVQHIINQADYTSRYDAGEKTVCFQTIHKTKIDENDYDLLLDYPILPVLDMQHMSLDEWMIFKTFIKTCIENEQQCFTDLTNLYQII